MGDARKKNPRVNLALTMGGGAMCDRRRLTEK